MFYRKRIERLEAEVKGLMKLNGEMIDLIKRIGEHAIPETEGSTFTISEYAKDAGVEYMTAYGRVHKLLKDGAIIPARKRKCKVAGKRTVTYKFVKA